MTTAITRTIATRRTTAMSAADATRTMMLLTTRARRGVRRQRQGAARSTASARSLVPTRSIATTLGGVGTAERVRCTRMRLMGRARSIAAAGRKATTVLRMGIAMRYTTAIQRVTAGCAAGARHTMTLSTAHARPTATMRRQARVRSTRTVRRTCTATLTTRATRVRTALCSTTPWMGRVRSGARMGQCRSVCATVIAAMSNIATAITIAGVSWRWCTGGA